MLLKALRTQQSIHETSKKARDLKKLK